MAIRITVPGIMRLIWLTAAEEMRAVNDCSMVQRSVSGRGGLFQRAVAKKLAVFRTPEGDIWPAFRDRQDRQRAAHNCALEAALSDTRGLLKRVAPETGALARYVRFGRANRAPEVIVQQMVGRLFFSDYAASEESYDAAYVLQTWLSGGPIKAYLLKRSGALQSALDQITRLARGNMACAHATALAMENIVNSIALMGKLARDSENLTKLDSKEAVRRTLRAPKRVIREARDSGRIENVRLDARSLVVFGVEAARHKCPDIVFFVKGWNQCPAHTIVPALLADIWQRAQAMRDTSG